MAEKVVSPGVFTNEIDLSFLPQGIGEIGAVVVGPTLKGPAYTPTIVESYNEFEQLFGGVSDKTYVPYTVQSYLKSAGRITVVRTLSLDGFTDDYNQITDGATTAATTAAGTMTVAAAAFDVNDLFTVSDGTTVTTFTAVGSDVVGYANDFSEDLLREVIQDT